MRPRPLTYVLATLILLLLFAPAPAYALGMAKVVIKVVDEDGRPMEGARVSLYFQSGGLEKDRTVGLTDEEGVFSASGFSSNGITGGGVNKEGYYQSVVHQDFYRKTFGMWQPWGKELKAVMRHIVNPVPMYVRNSWFDIPLVGKEIGFDLEKADWVIPYGQGTTADFIFKVERRYESNTNFDVTLTLTFTNPYDGILNIKDGGGGDYNVGSRFRLPRIAPLTGYEKKFEQKKSTSDPSYYANNPDNDNYIFRVRSEVTPDGKLKRAMYGKIRGQIEVGPVGHKGGLNVGGVVGMKYYLNPDYTPNLEFDPKRNLFVVTDPGENVRAP